MFAQIHQRTMPTKQKQYILPEVFLHLLSLCPQQNQNHCCILTKKSGVAYQQDYLILAICTRHILGLDINQTSDKRIYRGG